MKEFVLLIYGTAISFFFVRPHREKLQKY